MLIPNTDTDQVLNPMLVHRFKVFVVSGLTTDEQVLLHRQVTRVDFNREIFRHPIHIDEITSILHTIKLMVEVDDTGIVDNIIEKLVTTKFNLNIELMNSTGNTVITHEYTECTIGGVIKNSCDYSKSVVYAHELHINAKALTKTYSNRISI